MKITKKTNFTLDIITELKGDERKITNVCKLRTEVFLPTIDRLTSEMVNGKKV